ncbi:MAG: hypothetical protein QOF73_2477 [Thermomicrobiales bacterium]|nr:hypothetical protein [Thermomicrobiales bacterium]
MCRNRRSFAALAVLVAALIGVSSLFNIASTPSLASSHREAPIISEDPTADGTDLYAFVSPDEPDTVTLIANYYPGQDPAGGPNFYRFGDDVTYDINVDNNGDAVADITFRFNFSTTTKNPDVPLYNVGPIESLDSENWNVVQRYTITKITADGADQLAFEGIVPPVNIGPKSTPNYAELANAAIGTVDGMKVFAGQRDDPFWVNLGAVFDLVTIRTLPGDKGGLDDLQGLNVLTLALQIPIADLTATGETPAGADDTNAIIGVWTTASRFATTVINANGTREGSGDLVQVSRLGMPLVNEVVVPLGFKDFFNASQPKDDAQFADAVLHPVLPGVLASLYGITVPPADVDRTDIATVFLTGIPDLNQPENVEASEMLRLNMAIPPADNPNPLGVVGGDNAGFPNGRRLGDEVVDIELRAVAGVLFCTFAKDQCPDGDVYNVAPNNQLGGGVHGNDVSFLDEFPYVALPHQGFEHRHHSKSTPARKDRIAEPSAPADEGSPEAANEVTVTLDELNASGVSGTATLTAVGDNQTKVSIDVTGATGDHPAHIHTGTCDDLNPNPLFPLENVDANGKSETTVDVGMAELTGGGFAINLHKSQQEIGVYTACGNIGG